MKKRNHSFTEGTNEPQSPREPAEPIEAIMLPYDEDRIQPIPDDELDYYIDQKRHEHYNTSKHQRDELEEELEEGVKGVSDDEDEAEATYKETRHPLYFIIKSWKYILASLILVLVTVAVIYTIFQSETPTRIMPVFLLIGVAYLVVAFLLYRQRYLYKNTIYTATYHRLSECIKPSRLLFVPSHTQDWSIAMIHEKIKVGQSMPEQQLRLDSWTMKIMVYDPDTNKYEEREIFRCMRDGLRLRDVLLGVQKNTTEQARS